MTPALSTVYVKVAELGIGEISPGILADRTFSGGVSRRSCGSLVILAGSFPKYLPGERRNAKIALGEEGGSSASLRYVRVAN